MYAKLDKSSCFVAFGFAAAAGLDEEVEAAEVEVEVEALARGGGLEVVTVVEAERLVKGRNVSVRSEGRREAEKTYASAAAAAADAALLRDVEAGAEVLAEAEVVVFFAGALLFEAVLLAACWALRNSTQSCLPPLEFHHSHSSSVVPEILLGRKGGSVSLEGRGKGQERVGEGMKRRTR